MYSKTLIPSLLDEHVKMRAMLDGLRRHGVASAEGQQLLGRVSTLIVEHLRREDVQLYPELRAHAETQSLADTYANEMRELSREILAFLSGVDANTDNMTFARGFGKVMGSLTKRWAREEVRLYPAYDQYCAGVRKAG